MNREVAKPLYGKVILRGIIRTLTGLHIGAGREGVEIGALDNPVIVEPVTKQPYIPGSSVKGKMRSLLEKREALNKNPEEPALFFNRRMGPPAMKIFIHVCESKEKAYSCPVCRLFGSSGEREERGSNFPSRLRVRDSYLTAYSEAILRAAETDLLYTEIKYENALDRITAAANPRPIERIPPDVDFTFEVVYDVEDLGQLEADLQNLAYCLSVLEDDHLGGHGSRGYGKVKILLTGLTAKKVEAYTGPSDGAVKEFIGGPQITRKVPDKRPEDEELQPVDVLQDKIREITVFFGAQG